MFTGIVQAVGSLKASQAVKGDVRLTIAVGDLPMDDVNLGDSIATNGVCLTVIEFDNNRFSADVSTETLGLTTIGQLKTGYAVNLEKALRPQDRLGGHIVSGHVDGMGQIIAIKQDARSQRYVIQAPNELARYISHKGSITVDGVSLTVNHVQDAVFELCIVPHTLSETIFPHYQVGAKVNLEVDVLARYVERLLQKPAEEATSKSAISEKWLQEQGFWS